MNSFHWRDFDAEKRKQFINYLKHRNKKVGRIINISNIGF